MWLAEGVFWLFFIVLAILALDSLMSKLWDAVFDKPFWAILGAIAWFLGLFIKPEPKPPVPIEEWVDYDDRWYAPPP